MAGFEIRPIFDIRDPASFMQGASLSRGHGERPSISRLAM
jgi:hypothetical protein